MQLIYPAALTGEDTGIVGRDDSVPDTVISLRARVEFSGSAMTEYRGIVYAPKPHQAEYLMDDKATIKWEGRTLNIVNVLNYQTHVEIWVK